MLDYALGAAEGLFPDADLTVSEWSDQYRMLSQKASAEPGRWRTDRTPYLREIMDCLSPSSPVSRVVFMKSAQVGGSECGNNWLGFIVHHAPGPAMMVQPTVDTAKRFSKQRLAPMIEETPLLRDLIEDNRSRDSGNTMMSKEFRGGVLILTGANSAVGLRSMPVRYLFLDEVDAYPGDVAGEGDPISLAEKRTGTFARRKIYMCSTPTVKETSRIEREYEASDQRRFFVPCPHCGAMQHLKWKQMKWHDDDPFTAQYLCEAEDCGAFIEERHKPFMLAGGQWRATAAGDGRVAGFHISALYSPLGWKTWADIVHEFLTAKGDPPSLKTWVNTVLGETWEEAYAVKASAEGLEARAEAYPLDVAPMGVLTITAGVDVQPNRLAIVLTGWGDGEESWRIHHSEIMGDPTLPDVWTELDKLILAPVPHASGVPMRVEATCIDSGGANTHDVYKYARDHRADRVLAIKGQSIAGKVAIGRPTKQDINWRGKVMKFGVELYPVGSDTIKAVIYGRLKNDKPGPGYYHFSTDLKREYYDQLTAERQVTKYIRGFPKREWKKKDGVRNEALDCEVYAYAALQWVYTRHNRKTIWDTMRRKLGLAVIKPEQAPVVENKPLPPPPKQQPPKQQMKQRKGWVNNW